MNDTQQAPPGAGPDDDFDPQRLRSIADMRRSEDDRIVAGVCAGAARYLNVDPVVVRVLVAVLTIAGFAGLILYVAAWLLLPAEDEDRSIAAQWFGLDKNEEQVRVVGLLVAAVLAVLSLVGNSSWAWWGETPWWILPFALVLYVLWIRPRRRREQREQRERPAVPQDLTTVAPQQARKVREPRSPALLALTTSLAAIALAATLIYDQTREDVPWTGYVAVALAVVGVGLLIGTFFGHGGPLIGIGLLLAVALAIGSVFPDGRIGSQTPAPTVAVDVQDRYEHGVGELELDLTRVSDPERLAGRTIELDAGIGLTRIVVPDGLKVDVDAHVDLGEIVLFGRSDDGTDVSLADVADQPDGTAVSIRIDQQIGQIEVINR